MKKISVIVPCYYEEKSLPYFYQEVNNVSKEMNEVEFEIILVNDGSRDNTLKIIKEYAEYDEKSEVYII